MSDWPSTLQAAPIREWPGELNRNRVSSKFKAGLSDTLELLDREVWHLTENRTQRESLELLIAIPAGSAMWRNDGRPRAHAVPEHPGVIVSLDSKFGHLSYPCDTFTMWQDNLRAVALALEALRKVDRYGVTKRGEQYRGFLALEATAMPSAFRDVTEAMAFIADLSGIPIIRGELSSNARSVRRALRAVHPDVVGGDAARFQRAALAEAKLRQEGLL